MNPTTFTRRLKRSRYTREVGQLQLPSYFPEAHLELADYVFYRDDVGDELYILVREYSRVAEVRLFVDTGTLQNGRKLYTMSSDGGNTLEDVVRFLTSKYLHTPTMTFSVSYMGYHPDTNLCYTLEQSTVNAVNPRTKGPFAFQSYSQSTTSEIDATSDFCADLQAVIGPPENSASKKYAYVFPDMVIQVDTRRHTNRITPLVYDDAWREYIDQLDGDLITAEGDYATELVTQNI